MISRSAFPQWNESDARARLTRLIREHDGPVLLCLQDVQMVYGFVPTAAVELIAELCNVSRADVTGVLTFYADLRTTPPPAIPSACVLRKPVRRWGDELLPRRGSRPVIRIINWPLTPALMTLFFALETVLWDQPLWWGGS